MDLQQTSLSFPSDREAQSARELIATAHLVEGDLAQARSALGLFDDDMSIRLRLARVAYHVRARPDLALHLIDGAAADEAASVDARLLRADVLLALHRYGDALAETRALASRLRDPRELVALNAIAWAAETLLHRPRPASGELLLGAYRSLPREESLGWNTDGAWRALLYGPHRREEVAIVVALLERLDLPVTDKNAAAIEALVRRRQTVLPSGERGE